MSLEFGTYRVTDEGKMIKDSKRSHVWIVYFGGQRNEIVVKESFVSKKFRFYVQRRLIAQFKTKETDKKKGYDFQANGMYFHVRKTSSNGYSLYVNNTLFKAGTVSQGNIENFEQPVPQQPQQIQMKVNPVPQKVPVKNIEQTPKLQNGKINDIQLNLEADSSSDEGFDNFEQSNKNQQNQRKWNQFDPEEDDFGHNQNFTQNQKNEDFDQGFLNFDDDVKPQPQQNRYQNFSTQQYQGNNNNNFSSNQQQNQGYDPFEQNQKQQNRYGNFQQNQGKQNQGYGQQNQGYGQQHQGFGQQNQGYGQQSQGYGQQNQNYTVQQNQGQNSWQQQGHNHQGNQQQNQGFSNQFQEQNQGYNQNNYQGFNNQNQQNNFDGFEKSGFDNEDLQDDDNFLKFDDDDKNQKNQFNFIQII